MVAEVVGLGKQPIDRAPRDRLPSLLAIVSTLVAPTAAAGVAVGTCT
jgi:hypothetical protein